MLVLRSISEVKEQLKKLQNNGKTIGFVPTMGYLHEGHLSLLKESKKNNDISVLSIFVNPTQFGPNEDLDKYPRNEEKDLELAKSVGVNLVFIPDVEEMYKGPNTTVSVSDLTNFLCGKSRPTHFNGVTTVVNKLFNIVRPDNAYFGQKDAQQAIIIIKMVEDLDMDVKVNVCPIVREPDGLAMSSRNVYLDEVQRKEALVLRSSLKEAKNRFINGEKSTKDLKGFITEMINEKVTANIDYIEIVDFKTLKDIDEIERKALIAVAVKFGKTRLIDNIILEA
ncbi:pantoate--beta-alanine ligase [Mycoplasmatota bacterium WC44]